MDKFRKTFARAAAVFVFWWMLAKCRAAWRLKCLKAAEREEEREAAKAKAAKAKAAKAKAAKRRAAKREAAKRRAEELEEERVRKADEPRRIAVAKAKRELSRIQGKRTTLFYDHAQSLEDLQAFKEGSFDWIEQNCATKSIFLSMRRIDQKITRAEHDLEALRRARPLGRAGLA